MAVRRRKERGRGRLRGSKKKKKRCRKRSGFLDAQQSQRRVLSLSVGLVTFSISTCSHRSNPLSMHPPCAASTRGCALEGPGPIKMRLGTAMGAEASVPSSRLAVAGVVSPLRAPRDEAMMSLVR